MGTKYEIAGTGAETSTINSTIIVDVGQASDLPSTLVANTTYIVRGTITLTSPVSVTNSGCSIIGVDRNRDKLIWDGATGTTMLTVTDVDFDLENLCLSSNNTGAVLIEADNYSGGSYNDGRLKVFTIVNCQFRNCFDIASFDGFDLIDISNTLFWYCEAPNFGVKFLNTSKIEISSCEFIRWFRESTIPTPANYATCAMVELLAGTYGALNVSGCVLHPQVTQDGIKINTSVVIGAGGTIAANTFVGTGLTSGLKFFPDPSTGGYSNTECLKLDVTTNQGLPDSIAYGFFNEASGGTDTLTGNTVLWIPAEYGAVPSITDTQRFTFSSPGTNRGILTYDGTKEVFVTLQVSILWNDSSGGDDDYNFGILKNTGTTPESGTLVGPTVAQGVNTKGLMIIYPVTLATGDYFELAAQNIGGAVGDNVEIFSVQFLIKE